MKKIMTCGLFITSAILMVACSNQSNASNNSTTQQRTSQTTKSNKESTNWKQAKDGSLYYTKAVGYYVHHSVEDAEAKRVFRIKMTTSFSKDEATKLKFKQVDDSYVTTIHPTIKLELLDEFNGTEALENVTTFNGEDFDRSSFNLYLSSLTADVNAGNSVMRYTVGESGSKSEIKEGFNQGADSLNPYQVDEYTDTMIRAAMEGNYDLSSIQTYDELTTPISTASVKLQKGSPVEFKMPISIVASKSYIDSNDAVPVSFEPKFKIQTDDLELAGKGLYTELKSVKGSLSENLYLNLSK